MRNLIPIVGLVGACLAALIDRSEVAAVILVAAAGFLLLTNDNPTLKDKR